MSHVDIDVVDAHSVGGTVLASQLPKAIHAYSVKYAVVKILSHLGSARLRRLSFFGHGLSTGGIIVGGGETYDEKKAITVVAKQLTGEHWLRQLHGRFTKAGWIELHGCSAGEVAVVTVLRHLAHALQVRAVAAVGEQHTNKHKNPHHFDGQVIEADGRRGPSPSVTWKDQ